MTYRFTILAHKVGEAAEILALILMWTAIYGNQTIIKGFTLAEMITYVLIGNLFSMTIRNFLPSIMKTDIKDGGLSVFLVRPMGYFYFIVKEFQYRS